MNNNKVMIKPKFSVAIQTEQYQKLINNTLGDPNRARRFIASISYIDYNKNNVLIK